MMDSRCGLLCAECSYKQSHGCGGCVATNGHPFYGECPVAMCCQNKGHAHCGECMVMPCEKLYTYSYLDPEHGDKPQGKRVEVCRGWAASCGKMKWDKVLLTSAGWSSTNGEVNRNIQQRFLSMLGKPADEAKVLFIPTAAITDEAIRMADLCKQDLLQAGIPAENITVFNVGEKITRDQALAFDVIYFTGGDTGYLLKRIKETGFDAIIKAMVYSGKVYVGVSAGSLIATPNIGDPYSKETAGLAFINAYITVHVPQGSAAREDLPLPHIPLADNQALAVKWDGFDLIEN